MERGGDGGASREGDAPTTGGIGSHAGADSQAHQRAQGRGEGGARRERSPDRLGGGAPERHPAHHAPEALRHPQRGDLVASAAFVEQGEGSGATERRTNDDPVEAIERARRRAQIPRRVVAEIFDARHTHGNLRGTTRRAKRVLGIGEGVVPDTF